jgi:hypothetical protein
MFHQIYRTAKGLLRRHPEFAPKSVTHGNLVSQLTTTIGNNQSTENPNIIAQIDNLLVQNLNDRQRGELIAHLVKPYLDGGFWGGKYKEHFSLWEHHGFHITPAHYYEPLPVLQALPDSLWETETQLVGVDMNIELQREFLRTIVASYHHEFDLFPDNATDKPYEFHYNMGAFGHADAPILFTMVRHHRPRLIIELGSGTSTCIIADAIRKNGQGEFITIDPYPSQVVRSGIPGVSKQLSIPVQEVDYSVFAQLDAGDILFIDTAHVVKAGSDVVYIYLEILPRLKPGVVVHIHDIFLPEQNYPKEWVIDQKVFWNEQYLLQAFLSYNSGYKVLFSSRLMTLKYAQEMKAVFRDPWWIGCSFWMQRVG